MGANDECGIDSFSVVHDSFGTHACDIEQLGVVLREKFIEVYKEDVLDNFRLEQKISLVKPSGYGILDIEEVRNAEFFFS